MCQVVLIFWRSDWRLSRGVVCLSFPASVVGFRVFNFKTFLLLTRSLTGYNSHNRLSPLRQSILHKGWFKLVTASISCSLRCCKIKRRICLRKIELGDRLLFGVYLYFALIRLKHQFLLFAFVMFLACFLLLFLNLFALHNQFLCVFFLHFLRPRWRSFLSVLLPDQELVMVGHGITVADPFTFHGLLSFWRLLFLFRSFCLSGETLGLH